MSKDKRDAILVVAGIITFFILVVLLAPVFAVLFIRYGHWIQDIMGGF